MSIEATKLELMQLLLHTQKKSVLAKLKKVFWEGTEDWSAQLDSRAGMSGTLVLSDFTSRAVGRKD